MKTIHTFGLLSAALAVAGCASLSPDGNTTDLAALSAGKTAGITVPVALAPTDASRETIAKLLAQPLTAEAAVCIALLNNPGLHVAMATLGISDADRVQASTPPNPHLSLGRFKEGGSIEIERALSFNVVGLLALPWRAKWQSQQHELAKLQAAQEIITTAANTRKAWIRAVAAQQSAEYMADAKSAAEASGELARRMARVGNWSRLDQAREQVFLADATTQLAKAQQAAFSEREQLTRLMGLWGPQVAFKLHARLPELPKTTPDMPTLEERAIRERLDVRSSLAEADFVANSLGWVKASGFVNALDMSYARNTTVETADGHTAIKRGWGLELPIPVFDWGGAANAKAQSTYMRAVARVRQTAINARSEAREAYHGYRTAHDLAIHYQDEVVPLRKFISDETLLRYNGMLLSAFDLLSDMRLQIMAVNGAIDAKRDFWLAEADLQTALTGTSPGSLAVLKPSGGSEAKVGH